MRSRGLARRCAVVTVLAGTFAACFRDGGLHLGTDGTDGTGGTGGTGGSDAAPASSTTGAASTSAPTGDSTTTDVPACDGGILHLGPLGPPIAIPGGDGLLQVSDDAPRTLGVDDAGNFLVVWRATGADREHIYAQRLGPDGTLDGGPTSLLTEFYDDIRDPVLAVAPGGDFAVAWDIPGAAQAIRLCGVQGDQPFPSYSLGTPGADYNGASLAFAGTSALVAAIVRQVDAHTAVVELHGFPSFLSRDGAVQKTVSEHDKGQATPPTLAIHPGGTIVIAWGDPSGEILYRRLTPTLEPLAIVSTGLKIGGGTTSAAAPWTGLAVRPGDGAVAVAGRDGDQLVLRLFDQNDVQTATTTVDETGAAFFPSVDVASDPWGNLAVAWTACGDPDDIDPNCETLHSSAALRWFDSALVPLAPAAVIAAQASGQPPPLSLAVAPTGVTAVSYHSGQDVVVRVAPLTCPQ